MAEGAPDGDPDRGGRESDEGDAIAERPGDGVSDLRGGRGGGQSDDGAVDVGERLVGFQEEVAADRRMDDPAVLDLDIDRDQLAAGQLVLTAHVFHTMT